MRSRKYLALASSLAISVSGAQSAWAVGGPVDPLPAAQTQRVDGVETASDTYVTSANRSLAVNAAVSTVSQIPQVPGVQVPGAPAPPGVPGAAPALPGAGLPGAPAPGAGLAAGAVPPAPIAGAPAGVVPQKTIWGFLGLPPTFSAMGTSVHTKCAAVKAKLATTPLFQMAATMAEPMLAMVGLNHGPPPVGSPAAMNAANPAVRDSAAVQEANAIKQQEDAAPAKIAAIKYLATVDCKCYPGVKAALLQALKDCHEGVRFEAAKALGSACCCDREVAKILDDVANKRDDFGNYLEWSNRVRAAAAQSAASCAGVVPRDVKVDVQQELPPQELPPIEPPPVGEIPIRPQTKRSFFQRDRQVAATITPEHEEYVGNGTDSLKVPAAPRLAPEAKPVARETAKPQPPPPPSVTRAEKKTEATPNLRQAVITREDLNATSAPSSRSWTTPARPAAAPATTTSRPPTIVAAPIANNPTESVSQPTAKPAVHIDTIENKEVSDAGEEITGTVSYVDVKTGSVRINFPENSQPRAGSRADVFHKYLLRTQHLGELEIIGSSDGVTLARPAGELTIRQISKGDRIVMQK